MSDKGQQPIEIDLSAWGCPKGTFSVRIVLRKSKLANLIQKAIASTAGRAEVGDGALVVLVKKIGPAPAPHPSDTPSAGGTTP